MRVAVLTNSDVLSFPLLRYLNELDYLVGVGVKADNEKYFSMAFSEIGKRELIKSFTKDQFNSYCTDWLKNVESDVLLVLTFPWQVPDEAIKSPKIGAFNFHFGKLPNYPGADPIFWQLKNGEKAGGISVHKLTDKLDQGPLVFVDEVSIIPGENYGYHCSKLSFQAIESFKELERLLNKGGVESKENEASTYNFYEKPIESDLRINWESQSAEEIERLTNAANPRYEGSITSLRNSMVKLLEVSPAQVNIPEGLDFKPGQIVYADGGYGLIVACKHEQFLRIGIVKTNEGFYSGVKLFFMGFNTNDSFN